MEEGREYAERLLRLFASSVGPPAAAHGGPGGDCVRPPHRARVRVSAARLLLMAPVSRMGIVVKPSGREIWANSIGRRITIVGPSSCLRMDAPSLHKGR